MSSLTLLLFLILSLSLHACNGRRHLPFLALRYPNQLHFPTKMEVIHDSVFRALSPERKLLENYGDAANMILQKLFGAILGLKDTTTTITNSEHESSISAGDYFDDQTQKKELKRQQARSMLGSQEAEGEGVETVDSAENDAVEDIVAVDYAQPHRKPPIHNDKTLDR